MSNATQWDMLRLLPPAAVPPSFKQSVDTLPACRSFMHLHLGFDATGTQARVSACAHGSTGLDGLQMHHIVVNAWAPGVDAEHNVVLISIPSVEDPALAPAGKHSLHAYYPATEPYEPWAALQRGSAEYAAFKEQRARGLWEAVERVVPDIRQRVEVELVGTPRTHERFLRRHRGSYGPAVRAGAGVLPGPSTPVPGLLCCGDSTFPGIGLPAVAASGTIAANSLVPVWTHWQLLEELGV